MKRIAKLAGAFLALPVLAAMLVVEFVKLAYQATAYAAEVLYDGIRHRDWYL